MINKTFKYGELEAKLDTTDYIIVEKIENALKKYSEKVNSLAKALSISEQYKSIVLAVAELFIDVFSDDDAANKVLGGSTSVYEALQALNELVSFVQVQKKTTDEEFERMKNKYMPQKAK